jgi:hypothetical protein
MNISHWKNRFSRKRVSQFNVFLIVFILILIIKVSSLAFSTDRNLKLSEIPMGIHAQEKADYRAEIFGDQLPNVDIGILSEILYDQNLSASELESRIEELLTELQNPVPQVIVSPVVAPGTNPTQPESPTPSVSPFPTMPLWTQTSVPILSPTLTNTPIVVILPSRTPTRTNTQISSITPIKTNTTNVVITSTPTKTPIPTKSTTLTSTNTPTLNPTSTFTTTSTPTHTATSTFTPAPTQTFTDTPTLIPTATFTATHTPNHTATITFTPAPTQTFTNTPTLIPTATNTETYTPTHTGTPTLTPTVIPTPTFTITPTTTPTLPPTPTFTSTYTQTWTPTHKGTPIIIGTISPTLTSTQTATLTPSITFTPSPTPTATLVVCNTSGTNIPLIKYFIPSDGSINVPVNTHPVIVFNQSIDLATILYGDTKNILLCQKTSPASNACIYSTIVNVKLEILSINYRNDYVILHPLQILESGKRYTIFVGNNLKPLPECSIYSQLITGRVQNSFTTE